MNALKLASIIVAAALSVSFVEPQSVRADSAAESEDLRVLDIIVTDDIPADEDFLRVEDPRVDGNLLRMTVSYGGGCAQHDIGLYWTGAVIETYPVQVDLELRHNKNGDRCRMRVWKELAFDLTPVRESADGAIVVNVKGSGAEFQVRLGE